MNKTRHIVLTAQIDGPIDYDDAATLETIAHIMFRNEFGDRFKGLNVSLPDAPAEADCLLEPADRAEKRERLQAAHAEAAPEEPW